MAELWQRRPPRTPLFRRVATSQLVMSAVQAIICGMNENLAADTPQKLYTMEETADILRVSREYLYRMRQRGELVVVKFGRRTLVEADEIDRVIAAARAA